MFRQWMKSKFPAVLVGLSLAVLLFSALAVSAADEKPLTVAAAANLKRSFTEMGESFTAKTGIPVTYVFGATGDLRTQILNGAPVDVFAAADMASVTSLAEAKVIEAASVRKYAQGSVVMVARSGVQLPLYLSQLANKEIKVIAIANPKTAPYGKAAVEALMAAGIWPKIQGKVVFAKNVDEANSYVKTGNADVALISKALVYGTGTTYRANSFWDTLHQPIIQGIGLVAATKNRDAAQQFEQFVLSPAGQEIMKKYGYIVPQN